MNMVFDLSDRWFGAEHGACNVVTVTNEIFSDRLVLIDVVKRDNLFDLDTVKTMFRVQFLNLRFADVAVHVLNRVQHRQDRRALGLVTLKISLDRIRQFSRKYTHEASS